MFVSAFRDDMRSGFGICHIANHTNVGIGSDLVIIILLQGKKEFIIFAAAQGTGGRV